jgi:hypothetical protein
MFGNGGTGWVEEGAVLNKKTNNRYSRGYLFFKDVITNLRRCLPKILAHKILPETEVRLQ